MQANAATAITCVPLLDADTCDAALAALDAEAWTDGDVASPYEQPGSEGPVIRRCAINPTLPPTLGRMVVDAVARLNEQLFNFDVTEPLESDPLVVMRYAPGDQFIWHIDNAIAAEPFARRKLSFSVQLSDPADYEGGQLEFAMYSANYGGDTFASQTEQTRTRGSLVVFPSFHLHRVAPVITGVRHAIVGWLHGPPFR